MATEVVTKIISDNVPHMPTTPIHEPHATYMPRPVRYTALYRQYSAPAGATGKTKAEIAQLLGISRQHLYDVLRERKPVSPAVAVRLGKLFGDGAGVWVRMQAAYDTWHAEREEDVSGIPTLRPRAA